jgi:hypothetical protein
VTARRLLLSATALELLRRRTLPEPLRLPPGFGVATTAGSADQQQALHAAADELRAKGAMTGDDVHPALVTDLEVLAMPELAVTVRAARPGLDVTAVLAVRGVLGVSLLRTADDAVQLSAFAAVDLHHELARTVPAPSGTRTPTVSTVPLDALVRGEHRTAVAGDGALHAQVVAGPRDDRPGGVVGLVEWVHAAGGWTGLEPLPSVAGRPQVRLLPVQPADLATWIAPLAARALA